MVKIYKQPFAHGGDTIAIPDTSQPDGKMSNVDGWTPDYQLPKTDPNYKPVGRQEMNGVFKDVTEALGQMQVQGAASWSADGAPYPINAQVYHSGKQWLALRANSVAPVEGADWTQLSGDVIKSKVDKTSVKQVTGTSTTNIMSQKATTDALNLKADTSALNTKANTSTEVIAGTGLTGGGSLAANRTLNVSYGAGAGTSAQGNDSRIVNAVQNSRTISAGTGLTGGGNLTANRTLSLAASHTPIGSGQTWQNVARSRSVETTYTNTTGRPIAVAVVGKVPATRMLILYVGSIAVGKTLETSANAPENQLFAIVPAGSTYYASWGDVSAGTLISWVELR